jgi:hypothetical protein
MRPDALSRRCCAAAGALCVELPFSWRAVAVRSATCTSVVCGFPSSLDCGSLFCESVSTDFPVIHLALVLLLSIASPVIDFSTSTGPNGRAGPRLEQNSVRVKTALAGPRTELRGPVLDWATGLARRFTTELQLFPTAHRELPTRPVRVQLGASCSLAKKEHLLADLEQPLG